MHIKAGGKLSYRVVDTEGSLAAAIAELCCRVRSAGGAGMCAARRTTLRSLNFPQGLSPLPCPLCLAPSIKINQSVVARPDREMSA